MHYSRYNSENTLEVTVKSIMSSTYSDFEIILVDDGSEDKT
ncbi:glycosyltransferase family A protein [Lactiplantibacillus plantarum]